MKIECNSSLLMIETVLDVSDRNRTSLSTHNLTICMTLLWPCSESCIYCEDINGHLVSIFLLKVPVASL